ncbi:MAG TPA: phosphoribosylaminoimidazolesuccinocarboxamide synthase [Blastocatellia bacterium]|jgi:phosphoribosylaminoimidazole-succinocarboxamide synthase|nr:phosphoribosylaminoimidazolesuccinocarboxamide synthase [Blastocatellia bacterium]
MLSQELENERISDLPFLRSGKARDIYEVDDERLLIVATDRISAFDCVLPSAIPHKGRALTQLSRFWFERFSTLVPNHMIAADLNEFPAELLKSLSDESKSLLAGRSMLVRRAEVIPFECVVRGYLAGSGWKDYRRTGAICGHSLPEGLVESAELPRPIFTPATKAEEGHDINVTIDDMSRSLGENLTGRLEEISLKIYTEAAQYAETRSVIICDTKFEFGLINGQLTLVDEVLTPDSSRFWPRDAYAQGRPQPSFDKQFVRDYLETLDWDKRPPAPSLPPEITRITSEKYLEAYRLLTGHDLEDRGSRIEDRE